MVTNEELLVEMEKRHSVRSYKDMPLEEDVIKELNFEIKEINKESGLHIQLIVNEPKAFSGFLVDKRNERFPKFVGSITRYFSKAS